MKPANSPLLLGCPANGTPPACARTGGETGVRDGQAVFSLPSSFPPSSVRDWQVRRLKKKKKSQKKGPNIGYPPRLPSARLIILGLVLPRAASLSSSSLPVGPPCAPALSMEALLSLAFDNLSSYDGPKVRKGLRQVEGLLAQICLPAAAPSSTPDGQDAAAAAPPSAADAASVKNLGQLSRDPAFRQFFKLQEGFEWNVALRLIGSLDRLMAKGADGQNDLLILSSLDLIHGLLLLHPPSRSLFSREQNMNVRLPPCPNPALLSPC